MRLFRGGFQHRHFPAVPKSSPTSQKKQANTLLIVSSLKPVSLHIQIRRVAFFALFIAVMPHTSSVTIFLSSNPKTKLVTWKCSWWKQSENFQRSNAFQNKMEFACVYIIIYYMEKLMVMEEKEHLRQLSDSEYSGSKQTIKKTNSAAFWTSNVDRASWNHAGAGKTYFKKRKKPSNPDPSSFSGNS